jgi:hypothetical protein
MTFIILFSIYWIVLNAAFGRIDGGGVAKIPELAERGLVMSAFVLACVSFAGPWGLLAGLGVFGIATGHGQHFLELKRKYIAPERLDFILVPFFGSDPRTTGRGEKLSGAAETAYTSKAMHEYGERKLYWRCVAGMFVTGFVVGLPAVIIAALHGQLWAAVLFSLTGFAKAGAYILGDKLWSSTEPAEWINGALRGVITLAVIGIAS